MATAFAGLRGSGSWGTDERPKSFREMILWANPNGSAPLTALMAKMKKEGVDDPEFNWWEETLSLVRIQVNYGTTYISTDTTLTIDADGLKLVAGDVLQVEKTEVATSYSNELLVVSSVTSDTVIVVKRGQADTTAGEIADNCYLTKIGNVYEEGSTSPNVSQRNPTKLTNYCQIFKTAVGLTNTAKETKVRTGDGWANDKKRKMFDHSVAMELAFMFGIPYEDTTGTFPKRFTGGLRHFIETNVTIFTTTPTEDTLLDAIYPVFNYNVGGAGDERIVLAGNGFLNSLNKLARNSDSTRINFQGTIDVYGMRLQKWVTPQGTFAVKTHPLMNQHGKYTYSAFVIDPTGLIYRPLRDTKFEDNIQANDADYRKGQWLTEAGLEIHHEETMAYIGNFVV
jgi:hypothetical protein